MEAHVGDRLIVRSGHIGMPDRCGVIQEVRGPNGVAPYVVRWDGDGHEGLFFPGPDAIIESTSSPER
jgi:hypothetical protein